MPENDDSQLKGLNNVRVTYAKLHFHEKILKDQYDAMQRCHAEYQNEQIEKGLYKRKNTNWVASKKPENDIDLTTFKTGSKEEPNTRSQPTDNLDDNMSYQTIDHNRTRALRMHKYEVELQNFPSNSAVSDGK